MAHHNSIGDRTNAGDPSTRSFWHAPTLEELVAEQGVKPIEDVRVFYGTWPGEEDDGFEAMIDRLRHPNRDNVK